MHETITLIVNGEPRVLAAPASVASLLATLGLDLRKVAVERNEEIVSRSRYAETALASGEGDLPHLLVRPDVHARSWIYSRRQHSVSIAGDSHGTPPAIASQSAGYLFHPSCTEVKRHVQTVFNSLGASGDHFPVIGD